MNVIDISNQNILDFSIDNNIIVYINTVYTYINIYIFVRQFVQYTLQEQRINEIYLNQIVYSYWFHQKKYSYEKSCIFIIYITTSTSTSTQYMCIFIFILYIIYYIYLLFFGFTQALQ